MSIINEMSDPPVDAASRSSISKSVAPTAAASAIMDGLAEGEDRLPVQPLQWLRLMLIAACVGAAAGLVGALFRLSLKGGDWVREEMVALCHSHLPAEVGWVAPVGLCGLGGAIGLWLTQQFAPYASGSGIPRVEAVLRNHLRPADAFILPVKFFGGVFAIGSGLALGREGPTVQMGGTVGRLIADRLKGVVQEPWTLIGAGAGAGLAVAFNAPLAATLFVVEELLHRFSARMFSATLTACIAGTVVLRLIVGDQPDFVVAPIGVPPGAMLPAFFVLGAVAGVVGVVFNKVLLWSLDVFDLARHWPRGMKGLLMGAAAGLLAWFSPAVAGGGEPLTQQVIVHLLLLKMTVVLILVRFVLTMGSYGCGAPGGIFAPLLVLGALLGNGFAWGMTFVQPGPDHVAAFAIVAMAALFTAIVRSPLTGVVLLLEMTGSWTLILPMMAASVTAYAVPELFRNPPIYDSLRQRDEQQERAKGEVPRES
jgi:CIC family chloride channel protein